jgi:hypothetical protein
MNRQDAKRHIRSDLHAPFCKPGIQRDAGTAGKASRRCASDKPSTVAVADALKSALRLLPAQILLELAHVIQRKSALPAQALEITLRSAVG